MVDEEDNYTEASSEEESEGSEDSSDSDEEEESESEEEESEEESKQSKIISEKTNCSLPNIYANKQLNNQGSRTSLTSVLSKATTQISKAPTQASIGKPKQLFLNKENYQGKYCRGHTWNHVCKNPHCPNKNKK